MPTDLTTPRDKPREYWAPQTLFEFHHNHSMFRGVCGPTGSGKSVSMIMELAARARQQEPDSTGTRRTKWLVVRNTFPSLLTTTLATWRTWMPQAPVVTSPTIRWHWKQKRAWPDGTGVDMLVDFLAVDDPRTDIAKLRSFDYTGAWVNEAQEIQDRLIIEWIINRRGRYPDPQTAPITWSGVIADANAMSTTHWWYKWAKVVTPLGYKFWHQPPALLRVEKKEPGARQDEQGQWWVINPLCENLVGQALGARYWLDQVPGKDTAWIKLNLCGEYGASLFGKLVWQECDPSRHFPTELLEPLPAYPLQIGYDCGLTPSFAITQITAAGQFRILDEICLTNMGMRQAVRDALKPMLSAKYPGFPVFAVGDPAGNRRADSDESTAADEIRAQGIEVKECPTNLFKPRRDAVAAFMLKRVINSVTGGPGGEGFLVSPTCKMLLTALREGYIFGKIQVMGREGYKEEPVKNEYSHICDAIGYVATLYDRPKLGQQEMDRRFNMNGSPIELGFDPGFPMI